MRRRRNASSSHTEGIPSSCCCREMRVREQIRMAKGGRRASFSSRLVRRILKFSGTGKWNKVESVYRKGKKARKPWSSLRCIVYDIIFKLYFKALPSSLPLTITWCSHQRQRVVESSATIQYMECFFSMQMYFDISQSAGVNITVNDDLVPFSCFSFRAWYCACWLTVMAYRDTCNSNTCAFPAITSQHVCCDKSL